MTIATFDHYRASIEYRAPESVRVMDLDFKARDLPEAARAVKRFYDSRLELLPDFFGRLLCVKIYGFTVDEIDEKGNYLSRLTMCLFEWKCDMGWTYDERVDLTQSRLDQYKAGLTI